MTGKDKASQTGLTINDEKTQRNLDQRHLCRQPQQSRSNTKQQSRMKPSKDQKTFEQGLGSQVQAQLRSVFRLF